MGFTFHRYDLDSLHETIQDKLFRHCRSERHCLHQLFIVEARRLGAMHLIQRGHDFVLQISNMILINAASSLVHFLLCLNFMSLFYVYVYVSYELFFHR